MVLGELECPVPHQVKDTTREIIIYEADLDTNGLRHATIPCRVFRFKRMGNFQ